ncbi:MULTISPECIES: efflux RND transporter periplasmic adaptor subunit [Polaromonas]|uniref:Efflux RND transporter periplasmic adaptor subunit n=1 Tax=Polaromonas aquatica TaxID=332657 RepID=A0ABW1TQA3_9BURK
MKTLSSLSRRQKFWIATAVMAGLILAAWYMSHRNLATSSTPAKPPAVQVTIAQVRTQDVPLYQSGIGTVAATQSVVVKARIDGQLDRIGFTEGQDVKVGQMLAQLDPRTLQAQLQQAQAQKAKDQAQLGNAQSDLRRYTTLIAQDAATQQQFDTQKALVAQLDAAVKTDDAQINYATVQLGFTTISAPISGRVGARLVDVGNIVHAADATGIVVINQVDPISVVFTLPEGAFQQVNSALQGEHAPLVVQAFPRDSQELLGTGKLILLNNQIDTATGTVQLKGSFANPAHTLWPGQYVNVRLVLGQRSGASTVPATAVQRGESGTYVYAVDADNTARLQPVQVAQIQDGVAVISQGLNPGDRVVTDGQYKLKPGIGVIELQPNQGSKGAGAAKGSAPAPATGAGK